MDQSEAAFSGNQGIPTVHEKNLFVGNHVKCREIETVKDGGADRDYKATDYTD
jgi:hypothetical protein